MLLALGAAAAGAGCAPDPPPGTAAVPVAVTAAAVASDPSGGGASGTTGHILTEARGFVFRARNAACLSVGTAFAVTDGSASVVTNRHVAAGATQLDLSTWDGRDFTAQVAGHADDEDLAVLLASPPRPGSAPLAAADPLAGAPVYVAGYPLGNQLTVTSGRVLGTVAGAQVGLGGPVMEISNPIQHGNSGSPVLDSSGNVVGVVFALDTASGDGLAMPVSELRALLSGSALDPAPLPCAPVSP
ncbi:MAG: trypsin-like peptidase domain-containing protein [Acidobacteriota bacterium]|nr:trypsin-like peptidase domain-containing protein [Acidobacteriota bacterium]